MSRYEQYPDCEGVEYFLAEDGRLVAMVVRSSFESLALFPPFLEPTAEGAGQEAREAALERERNAKAVMTPPEFPLQITLLNRDPDKVLKPHYHSAFGAPAGKVRHQIMVTLRGRMRVGVYTVENDYLGQADLEPGDLILLTEGHSIEFLEPRTKVFEIKQGPILAGGADEMTRLGMQR